MNRFLQVCDEDIKKKIRSSHRRNSFKKGLEACNFIKKETLAQVFSYEFCEISQSTFFYRTPPVKFLLTEQAMATMAQHF